MGRRQHAVGDNPCSSCTALHQSGRGGEVGSRLQPPRRAPTGQHRPSRLLGRAASRLVRPLGTS